MRSLAKALNKILYVAIILAMVCASFVLFVGCNSGNEKTDAYAVFKDNLGNEYKVSGKERQKEEYDWRVFESFVKLDINSDVEYTFTCDLFYTKTDKKVVENDFICGIYNLILVGESAYDSIKHGHYKEIDTKQAGDSITLSGAESGRYYLLLFATYVFDNNETADCYFFQVIIGGEK